jgi:gamma-glutamyltranspeptidase/glutathione hydrolase
MPFRFAYGRRPAAALDGMVASSQVPASRAGVRILERGGSAADAAIAAAAMLCVTEPMSTGIGGDCFAIVARGTTADGLDAAGPAPAGAAPLEPVAERGRTSVTVPGAVAGWAALSERYGRLGLDACLADAIDAAERGYAAGWHCAEAWRASPAPPELGPPPAFAQRVRLPELAATLRAIAEQGPDAFYRGSVAEAIASCTWLEEEDLGGFAPRWVEPLRLAYRGTEVLELPPPGQGVAALEALGILEGLEPTLAGRVASVRLALEDALATVRDGADVSQLLDPAHLARRRAEVPGSANELAGGTVYLCAVDGERLAVSFIQSLYERWGSLVVAPGTGVVLQNRGACFAVSGRVEPGRRPYHTIIPGMLFRDGAVLGPFGNMGGFIQAQAHAQLVAGLVDDRLDPQAALDRPRFRVDGEVVRLEEGLWAHASELEAAGEQVVLDEDTTGFGGGQMILLDGDGLVGGTDPRKDGCALGS